MSTIDEAEAVIADLCAIAEPLTPDGEVFRAIYWAIDVIQRQSAALSAEKAAREEAERAHASTCDLVGYFKDRLGTFERAFDAAEARATTAEAETARLRERVKEMEARLEESIYAEMMAAYHVGVERDGKWMDCARSEGEWLRGELGITEPGWHDAETIKAMIPEAARRLARSRENSNE